jgi:signal transduction histidine kinase
VIIEDVETDSDFMPYRRIAAEAGFRAVQTTPRRNEAVVGIRDNGIGIAPEELERIFEMFSQLRADDFGSSGLGIGFPSCAVSFRCTGVR